MAGEIDPNTSIYDYPRERVQFVRSEESIFDRIGTITKLQERRTGHPANIVILRESHTHGLEPLLQSSIIFHVDREDPGKGKNPSHRYAALDLNSVLYNPAFLDDPELQRILYSSLAQEVGTVVNTATDIIEVHYKNLMDRTLEEIKIKGETDERTQKLAELRTKLETRREGQKENVSIQLSRREVPVLVENIRKFLSYHEGRRQEIDQEGEKILFTDATNETELRTEIIDTLSRDEISSIHYEAINAIRYQILGNMDDTMAKNYIAQFGMNPKSSFQEITNQIVLYSPSREIQMKIMIEMYADFMGHSKQLDLDILGPMDSAIMMQDEEQLVRLMRDSLADQLSALPTISLEEKYQAAYSLTGEFRLIKHPNFEPNTRFSKEIRADLEERLGLADTFLYELHKREN